MELERMAPDQNPIGMAASTALPWRPTSLPSQEMKIRLLQMCQQQSEVHRIGPEQMKKTLA